jgi:hypothetical protein
MGVEFVMCFPQVPEISQLYFDWLGFVLLVGNKQMNWGEGLQFWDVQLWFHIDNVLTQGWF